MFWYRSNIFAKTVCKYKSISLSDLQTFFFSQKLLCYRSVFELEWFLKEQLFECTVIDYWTKIAVKIRSTYLYRYVFDLWRVATFVAGVTTLPKLILNARPYARFGRTCNVSLCVCMCVWIQHKISTPFQLMIWWRRYNQINDDSTTVQCDGINVMLLMMMIEAAYNTSVGWEHQWEKANQSFCVWYDQRDGTIIQKNNVNKPSSRNDDE